MSQNTPGYRKVIREFLLIYRSEPCLWQAQHEAYYDRAKKTAALDKLVEKYREVDPNADREMVTKKINGLRTSYNYEKKRVDAAKRYGSSYEPKLWYYKELSFVDSSSSRRKVGKSRKSSRSSTIIKEEFEVHEDEEEKEYLLVDISEEHLQNSGEDNSDDNLLIDEPVPTPSRNPKKRRYDRVSDPLSGNEQSKHPEVNEDSHDIYSKYFASKLRGLPKEQRLLAERLINDVVFQAEWGNLTLGHKIVNTEPVTEHYSPSPSSY